MFVPDKVLALNNTIGLLVAAAMDPEQPNVEALLGDFRLCLNDYDAWAESFWTGKTLDVEQVFKVGNEVRLSAPTNSTTPVSSTVAACSASGSLTLVHMFDAARFVPIGNTPVMLEPYLAEDRFGEPIYREIGPSGILEIPDCERSLRYRVTFFPHVSANHVKALYASYQDVISDLEAWLRNEWATEFERSWAQFAEAGFTERYRLLQQADWRGFENSLNGLWDDVKQVYDLITDLQANSEKLLEYLTEVELQALLDASAETIANVLLMLSDEPLMFIHLAAITSWLRMLPPQHIAEVVAEIRTGILIGLLLARFTGSTGMKLGISAKVLNKVKSERARNWLAAASLRLAELTARSDLTAHAGVLKPLAVSVRNVPLNPAPAVSLQISAGAAPVVLVKNPVAIAREKSEAMTRLVRQEHRDDAPDQAKNPNGDSADCGPLTCTNGCPVSMVTGEELLTLSDGSLDGILPFDFTRLYRTSAVEINCGLGFGWRHSLAHQLEIDGDTVIKLVLMESSYIDARTISIYELDWAEVAIENKYASATIEIINSTPHEQVEPELKSLLAKSQTSTDSGEPRMPTRPTPEPRMLSSVRSSRHHQQCPDLQGQLLHPHASRHQTALAPHQRHHQADVDRDSKNRSVKAKDIRGYRRCRRLSDQRS